MSVNASPPPENLPPPPPPTTGQTAKTPPMVTWAFVLSVLGICGVTAAIGIVLGFLGRKKAQEVGKGTGLATAAIVIGAAWLVLIAIGALIGGGTSDTPDTSVVEETIEQDTEPQSAPEAAPQPSEESTEETLLTFTPLDITIDALPAAWNEAIQAYGVGNPLPDTIDGEPSTLAGVTRAYYDNTDGSYVSIQWDSDTGDIIGMEVGGFTDDADVATGIAANAAAMAHTAGGLSLQDAEDFIVDELVGDSIDNVQGTPEIAEIIEQPDRVYRFTFFGNTMSFSLDAVVE
jgi:hypothetical protein